MNIKTTSATTDQLRRALTLSRDMMDSPRPWSFELCSLVCDELDRLRESNERLMKQLAKCTCGGQSDVTQK